VWFSASEHWGFLHYVLAGYVVCYSLLGVIGSSLLDFELCVGELTVWLFLCSLHLYPGRVLQ